MEDIYNERSGKPDTPHRHDYFTVLIVKNASGKHDIDFKKYDLDENQVYFISPGQVHQLIETHKPSGFAIVFSHEFLNRNNIPLHFIEELKLFNDFGESPPLLLSEPELNNLNVYCEELIKINNSIISYKYEALGAVLKLILINCYNLCSKAPFNNINPITKNKDILRQFKTLINHQYKTNHITSDYASQLFITPDHLNRIVKAQTGKTAKEHIQSRILLTAKRLLYFGEQSIKEIGYELGFSEPSNFSNFFKKNSGIPPSQFKNSI